MLYLKNATNDPQSMSQDGDAILRSLQNKSLPMIDLLVRESLQNSLDASLPNEKITEVEFQTGVFQSDRLATNFEKIDNILTDRYPGEQKYLSISDKNTYGLTGDYTNKDIRVLEKSNFHKLVFGIGKNQDKEGAGGSWGLGKTSFFRIGIGLVIYYTRIAKDNIFEERLIASMIESPKSKDRILKENHRGIAWWGEINENLVYPITDSNDIKDFLKIFNISPYRNEETGTTIIIPYINQVDKRIVEDTIKFNWEDDLSSQIQVSVQRWYNPRLMNYVYSKGVSNPFLSCTVNNKAITPIDMEPIFLIFQELYNSALTKTPVNEKITVVPIDRPQNIMKKRNISVGNVAFCEVSKEDLRMTPPHNKPSGLAYLGVKDDEILEKNYSKIIAYSRKPGMIVEYGIDEGEWLPHNVAQKDEHLLLAFFVPNSFGRLADKFRINGYENLESYLRATESADHANWIDEDGITIVRRIKSYTKNAVYEFYQGNDIQESTSKVSGLSRRYGKILMPPKNFGRSSRDTSKKAYSVSNNKTGNKLSSVTVEKYQLLDNNRVKVKLDINVKKNSVSELFYQLLTQDKRLDEEQWNKLMTNSLPYPFIIDKVQVNSIDGEKYECFVDEQMEIKYVSLIFKMKPLNYLEVQNKKNTDVNLQITMYLKVMSNQYIPAISIRTNKLKQEGDS